MEMLQNNDSDVQGSALKAIAKLAPDELAKLAPQLVGVLKHSNPCVRSDALCAISNLPSEELAKLAP